ILPADSLMANAPITQLDQMLTARIPGVQVIFANGTTGSSNTVRIRGLNTLAGNPNPILIIDGVRGDVTFGPFHSMAGTSFSGSGQTAGRFNDYNPEDFESVEVVKGPAAATLYGTDAANGVIVVKTKHGSAGRTNWTGYAEDRGLGLPLSVNKWNY